MSRSKDPPLISGTQFSAIVVLTLILFVIIDFGRRTTAGYYVSQAEKDLGAEIETEKALNELLLERLDYVKTDGFVEEWAREKAHMVRKGDRPLIVVTPDTPRGEPLVIQTPDILSSDQAEPNWYQWWRFFFDTEPGTLLAR